jgi:U2-associated protein SR140
MAFSFSIKKAGKVQLGSRTKAEEDAKAREDKNALDKVLAEFRDEHGDDGDDGGVLGEMEKERGTEEAVFVPTGSKRHFTGRRSMKSGPGTLAPEPGMNFARPGGSGGVSGPPQDRFGAPVPLGMAGIEGVMEENVYTTVIAKASNLPPTIDSRRIEDLFTDFPLLKVVKVEKIPPSRPSNSTQKARPSASMKIIFDKDTNARDLDIAMNKMSDKKYLGKGYYLHLDRYLGGRSISTKTQEEPFGATFHEVEVSKGYAPPPDLGGMNKERAREETMHKRMLITANAPPDLPTLRLIHQTIEGVVEGGTEFEAALMQDPQVQEEERFAWLYDQKHPLNRYYRWRLHEIIASTTRPDVFHHQPDWKGPKEPFVDEYAVELGDLNNPLEDEDSDDEEEKPVRTTVPIGDVYPGRIDTGYGVLSPKSRALLIWMLSTVPPSSALYDEVAAFSVFAVDHVIKGMDEVVYLLVTNIIQPFVFSKGNVRQRPDVQSGEDETRRRAQVSQLTTNALRIISDVALVTSKEAGVCYKYRVVIGTQLVERQVFEYLETLPSQLVMGRMGETQYRGEINAILKVWQDEHLFEKHILNHLDDAFNARTREKEQEELERKVVEKRKQKKGAVPRRAADANNSGEDVRMDIDQDDASAMNTPDGANDDSDVMSAPNVSNPADTPDMSERAHVEPEPEPMQDIVQQEPKQSVISMDIPGETAAARARRLRPKAEDMFASDEE